MQDRLSLKGSVDVSGRIVGIDFIVLKPFGAKEAQYTINVSVLVCFEDGTLNLHDLKGELLYRYKTGHSHLFCASTQSTDEIYIATIDKTALKVHKIDMPYNGTVSETEFGLKCNKANMNIYLYSETKIFNETVAEPTSLISYSRLGKKYWIVGDSKGNINVFHYNGDVFNRGTSGVSSIRALDRSGQQLAYAGDNTIGIYNLGAMEPHIVCEPGIYPVADISIDFTSSIVHAAFDNGDIMTYDTRFSTNNSPTACKAIARLVNKYGASSTKLTSVKGSLLA